MPVLLPRDPNVPELFAEPVACHSCDSRHIHFSKPVCGVNYNRGRWQCNDCYAAVFAVFRTRSPMGYMASSSVRAMRKNIHDAIEPRIGDVLTRHDVYCYLAAELGLSPDGFHIGTLTEAELDSCIDICASRFERWAQRRIKKYHDKRDKEIDSREKQAATVWRRRETDKRYYREEKRKQRNAR